MNIPMHLRGHHVAGGALIVVFMTLVGCTSASPTLSRVLTAIPVAMQVTNTPEAEETRAVRTIEAALTPSLTPIPTAEQGTPNAATLTAAANATIIATMLTDEPSTATPDRTATAAKVATEEAAIAATLTALAPTITSTPTPDLGATATAAADKMATAIAATLTAITPTPDLAATETMRVMQMQTAIAATLTAQPTATPDVPATQTMQAHLVETMVAATLTAQPTPIPPPTNTPLPLPPTNTPVPPPPANPPPPATSGFFRGHVTPVCTGERNMTWFEGTVYVNNQPANGYQVVFKSYLVPGDEPVTSPAVTGPHDGYTNWPNGYYSHIVNDYFAKKHLEIWIINNARQAISDRVHWDSDGPDGPCNKAVIDFYQ